MSYRERLEKFQGLLRLKGIDVAMFRDRYAFRYFTGTSWDPPALLIPAEGEPVIFAIEEEIPELQKKTWISNFLPYRDVKVLINSVHKKVDNPVIGFNLDIDASALLYSMFEKIHGKRKIVDVHPLLMELRMFKDPEEIELIRKAGEIAAKGMEAVMRIIKPGVKELDIAAEAEYAMRKAGAEDVFVYVNSGPPRVHARPRNEKVRDYVLVDLMPSCGGYFYDFARTFLLKDDNQRKAALKAVEEVHRKFSDLAQIGLTFHKVEESIKGIYQERGFSSEYLYGFGHGVGLRFEETPILTIVPGDRMKPVKPSMVVSVGHAPLSGVELGTIKIEDTYLITEKGAERLGNFPLLPQI